MDLPKEELSLSIPIIVKISRQVDDKQEDAFAQVFVAIGESIDSQLQQTLCHENLRFDFLFFKNKQLDEKDTCKQLKIKALEEVLAVVCGPGGGGRSAIMWRRYPTANIRPDSIWYMPTGGSFDCLKFKAKRAVRILGQGCTGPI